MKINKLLIAAAGLIMMAGCDFKDPIYEPEDIKYAITVTCDENGSVTASHKEAGVGTEVTVTAIPGSGCCFRQWTVESGSITLSDNTAASASFTMPSSDVHIKAEFEALPPETYAVTVTTDGNGTASAEPSTAVSGTTITLRATASDGYIFDRWTVVSGSVTLADAVAASTTFTMPGDNVTVKAEFRQPDPTHGTITLTTDWTNRSDGISVPASYQVKVGDYSEPLSGTTNKLNNDFEPGAYPVYVYNPADHISVNGTTVTANYTAGTLDWLFTCAMNADVAAGQDTPVTALMQQQVRQLTLVLDITGAATDKVATVTGTLSGVAGSLDFSTGVHGSATSVALTFTKDTDGKWKAVVNLLGITGTEQKLSGTVTFMGGSPADMPFSSNLTNDMTGFNDAKKEPLQLTGALNTTTGAGFTATINGWTAVSGGTVTAGRN